MTKPTYYLVGGAVRDELLGLPSKDADFAVEAESYEAMIEDLLARGVHIWNARPEFVSVRAKDPTFGPSDFTLCRRDGFYSDGRRPDSVHVGTIFDDLSRRDFTVNAIAKAASGGYLDPHGGRDDLASRLLRCVGDSRARFREDSLRLLRAVRFSIVRGFSLHPEIEECLRDPEVLAGLSSTSVERAYEEMKRCYDHDTLATVKFLRWHERLEDVLFSDGRLGLEPKVRGA